MDDAQLQLQLLLDAVAAPLEGLLSIDVNGCEPPQLAVSFWLIRGGAGSPHKIDARVRPALHALARLMGYSQAVSGSSAQKARLWRRVLQDARLFSSVSTRLFESGAAAANKLEDWVLASEAFPRVRLDFSRTKVRFELVDAVSEFFLAPEAAAVMVDGASSDSWSGVRARMPAVDLSFAKSQLKSQELMQIQQLLDRVCVEEERQRFRVRSLDLSDNGMNTLELLVVAAMLKKNDVYRLEELALENVVGRNLAQDGLSSLRTLVEGAFDVDTIVKTNSAAMRRSSLHGLARLDLQGNSLSIPGYASICSAFRHSRAVRELSLAATLSLVDASEREQCWRWLAFGCFYPRPSGLRATFKRRTIDLSMNPLYPNDVEVLRRTLLDPASELVAREDAAATNRLVVDNAGNNKVGVCSVQKGTRIYAEPDVGSAHIFQLDHQTELETICSRAEWLCVLIPGFGFGWAQTERVASTDYQALEDDDGESGTRVELVMNNLSASESTSQALSSLFEIVGSRICALEMRSYRMDQGLLGSLLNHCTRLERLDLEGCSLIGSEMTALLDALRGELGNRLLSLSLNSNYIGFAFVEQLSMILANSERIPALRELRLRRSLIGNVGMLSLYSALGANKTVSTLELDTAVDAVPAGVSENLAFNAMYQGELLRIDPLSSDRKLALLSAVSNSLTATRARSELDRWMLAEIFQFAAQEVRRRVYWR